MTNPNKHKIGTYEHWLTARLELLEEEKELTRRSDELALKRQQLPWVRLDKEYSFDTDAGVRTLADLFQGRSQLLMYHFMFGPDYKAGCISCSSIADTYNGVYVHLLNHDVSFATVSRAQLPKLQAYKKRMGWTFPWVSSFHSDFGADFNVRFTEEEQRDGRIVYYRREQEWPVNFNPAPSSAEEGVVGQNARAAGTDPATYTRDRPGLSAFVLQDGVVYHTYSAYARGLDAMWGMYQLLDRAPKGRNETSVWWRRHDEYAAASASSPAG